MTLYQSVWPPFLQQSGSSFSSIGDKGELEQLNERIKQLKILYISSWKFHYMEKQKARICLKIQF